MNGIASSGAGFDDNSGYGIAGRTIHGKLVVGS